MKTYIKFQAISVLAILLLLINACTEKFDEINTSNSLVTEELVDVELLLTRVQVYAMHRDQTTGTGTISNYSGMNARNDNRPFASGDSPGIWNDYYENYGRNLSAIIEICEKRDAEAGTNDNANKIAIARIIKAWAVSKVTDVYGDVPYSESCLPSEQAETQPRYDTQESIYQDLFNELKEAVAQMDESKDTYGSGDLVYEGDLEQWKKFANSLRLRLALRLRYVNRDMAIANMSDLTEADLITSLDDDAYILSAADITDNQNSLYSSMINSGRPHSSHYIGKTMVDIMIGNGDPHNPDDPRLAIYCDTAYATWPGTNGYDTIDNFGYRGHPVLGVVPVEEKYPWGAESTSKFSAFWYSPVIERPILRSSEVYFALAEAALFGLKTGDAEALYQKGIDEAIAWTQRLYNNGKSQLPEFLDIFYTEVFADWDETWEADYFADKEITQAEIEAFKLTDAYLLTGTDEEKLEQIMNQKIIALFPLDYQGWFEWRRTGYPRVLIGSDTDDFMGESPRRMPWPQNEQTVNSASYEEVLQRFGGTDNRLGRVWWDVNDDAPHEHPGTVPSQPQAWVN